LLPGFETHYDRPGRARSDAYAVVLLVCLALLAVLTVAQVAHVHANASDADHCPMCVALHSAVPVAASVAAIVLVKVEVAAPVFALRAVTRYWHAQLFTRPPPIG